MDPQQKSLRLLRILIRFGHKLGFSPYCRPKFGNNVQYHSSVYRKIWLTALLLALAFYLYFLGFQLYAALRDPRTELKTQFGLIYITAGFYFMATNHYTQVSITKPDSPRVFTSLSQTATHLSPVVKITAAAVHLVINLISYYAYALHLCSVFLFAENFSHLTDQLSGLYKKRVVHEGHYAQFAIQYRALAVVQTEFAGIYGNLVFSYEVFGIVVIVLNIYQAVVFGDYRAAILAICIAAAFSWFLTQLAGVYETSTGILGSWERELHKFSGWGRAFHRSCRPISVPVGRFFVVDHELVFTVLSIVIDNYSTNH